MKYQFVLLYRSYFDICRKLTERTAVLQTMKFKKSSDAEKWRRVLISDMMSSEESDMDGEKEESSFPSMASCQRFSHVSCTGQRSCQTKKSPKSAADEGACDGGGI